MTRLEFTNWLQRLSGMFPNIADTFGKMGDEQLRIARDEWYGVLRNVAAEDAEEATTQIFRTEGRRPFFDQMPITVRRVAYSLAAERRKQQSRRHFTITGEFTYRCRECMDTGFIIKPILETSHAERAKECYQENAVKATAAVRCGCRR